MKENCPATLCSAITNSAIENVMFFCSRVVRHSIKNEVLGQFLQLC